MKSRSSRYLLAAMVMLAAALIVTGFCGCAPAKPVQDGDSELMLENAAARQAFYHGDLALARQQFQNALARSWAMDDAKAIVDADYNLAAVDVAMKQYDGAATLLADALDESNRSRTNTADILLVASRVERLRHHAAAGLALARRIATDPLSKPDGNVQVESLTQIGLFALDGGDMKAAQSEFNQAAALPAPVRPGARAQLAALEGALAGRRGDYAAAAAAFDRQADLLREAHQYAAMATALATAGNALVQARQPDAAAERYFRAARCAAGNGDTASALKWIDQASSQAKAAGDEALAGRIKQQNFPPATRPTDRDW